jgi:multiple sugar transport system permease protein
MSMSDAGYRDMAFLRSRRRARVRRYLKTFSLHILLVALSFSMVLPFLWMVMTSLKPLAEVGLESWLPSRFQWDNYAAVFEAIPFARFYWNSILIASWVTLLQVFTSAMAAYSFSRLKWPGRDKVFILYLCTMMLPGLVMMIPNYQIMISLRLVDTFTGLTIPAAFSAFGTFLLRQFMLTIPSSLDQAAEIDGASKWQIFWDVIMPLSRPGIITLVIFTFMGNYRSFFWPLVMLKSVHKYTLPIGLLYFDSTRGQSTHLLMAAVTMSIAPMVVLFVVLQKYLVKGIQLGAVKG